MIGQNSKFKINPTGSLRQQKSKFIVIILLGRSGSGKGTQASKLSEKFGLKLVSSGNLLRAKAKDQDFVGRKVGEIMSKGGILPTPVVFDLWMDELRKIREQERIPGIVFEGSPRKLYEAWLLQEALEFFGFWDKVAVFHLDISKEESKNRLLKRNRPDDTVQSIDKRLEWYELEVVPVIDFYRGKEVLIHVNGEQAPDEVFKEIIIHL